MLTRRSVLELSLAVPALGHLLWPRVVLAEQPVTPLIVVFLRGGCDALNLVAPASDRDYQAARGVLAVQDSGAAAGLPLRQGLVSGIDFRWHPEAALLADLYSAGHLAVVHAAGLTDGTRSHFEAQDLIERGLGKRAELKDNLGWMTRALSAGKARGTIPALSGSAAPALSLAGANEALALPDPGFALKLPGGVEGAEVLRRLHARGNDAVTRRGRDTLRQLAFVAERLPRDGAGNYARFAPPGGKYDSSPLGKGLSTAATLLKLDTGLGFAVVNHPGWDTHSHQSRHFGSLVRQLSTQLALFHGDMTAAHLPYTLVTLTEFGRRLRANHSGGTDHGLGALMLVMGTRVHGGRLLGSWPGLAAEQLDRGVDLAVTTDYRAVLFELLRDSLGRWAPGELSRIFPGYATSQDLGLLRV